MAGEERNNILRQHTNHPRNTLSYPSSNKDWDKYTTYRQNSGKSPYTSMPVYENIHHRYRSSDGYSFPLLSPTSSQNSNKTSSQSTDTLNNQRQPTRSSYPTHTLNGRPPQLLVNGDPFTFGNNDNFQSYQRTPYHQIEKGESTTTQNSSNEFLNVPLGGGGEDEQSDVVDINGKRLKVKGTPEVRLGLLGVGLIILAACFLVVSTVVSTDPWNNMKGYMITGLVLVGLGVILIVGNMIWCCHVEAVISNIIKSRSQGSRNIARPESQNTTSTDARTNSEINNNTHGSDEWLTIPVKTKALAVGVTVPNANQKRPMEVPQENYNHNLNIYSNPLNQGFDNFAYDQDKINRRLSGYGTASTTVSSANTLDTAFVQPDIIDGHVHKDKVAVDNDDDDVKPKKRKSGRKKPVEYPRTSTKKDLMEQGDHSDSAPENVTAAALRQKLRKDPRLTGSGYFQIRQSGSGYPNNQFPDQPQTRSRSAPGTERDYSHQRKRLSEFADGILYTDSKPDRKPRSKSQEPPRLSHEYPHAKIPMDGLLDVAQKSYNQYIKEYGNDNHTPQRVVKNNVSNNLRGGYQAKREQFEMANGSSNARQSRWDTMYSKSSNRGSQPTYVNSTGVTRPSNWNKYRANSGVEDSVKNIEETVNSQKRSINDSGILLDNGNGDDNVFDSQENIQGSGQALPLYSSSQKYNPHGNVGPYRPNTYNEYSRMGSLEYMRKPSAQDQEYYNAHGHYLKKPSIDSSLQTYI